jgi:vitamin B12 transporter
MLGPIFRLQLICVLLLKCLPALSSSNSNLTVDTTISLNEFSITESRYTEKQTGHKVEALDSASIHSNLGLNISDVLVQINSFFIKTYGLGGLSTGSFRGATASQTATLWNGFNLQSPMNGVLDYSLIPAWLIDDANLSFGGSTSLFGGGSIGGTILLSNKANLDKGISAALQNTVGSFDSYQQAGKIQWSNSKMCFKLKAFQNTAKNNFPFYNTAEAGSPKQFQQNAQLKQQGALFESYIKLSARQQLSLRFWYQNTEREIPAPIVTKPSEQSQNDLFYRSTVEWNLNSKNHKVQVRAAYFDESLQFFDPSISLLSNSRSHNLIAEAEDAFTLGEQLKFNVGYNSTYINATSNGYGQKHVQQNRNSVFASVQTVSKNKSFLTKFSLRKEMYGSQMAPLTASFGSEKIFFKKLKLRGNFSRNYRLPTFNDLFWTEQGAKGNENLNAESAWCSDIGIAVNLSKNKLEYSAEISGFNNSVKNMIVWQPTFNGIWSPNNIQSVWSRGLESNLDLKLKLGKFSYQLNGKYTFTKSTNNTKDAVNAATYRKQIFYVPLHTCRAEFSLVYLGIKISYLQNYTGKRYTNNEETEYLPAFTTGNIVVAKTLVYKKVYLALTLQALNIWNEQYQVIAWRPMPLANYQFGISLGFNEK